MESTGTIQSNNLPKPRGFAAMSPEVVSELARKGGKAAHAKGTAHTWSKGAEASAAGRKGNAKMRENWRKRQQQIQQQLNTPTVRP